MAKDICQCPNCDESLSDMVEEFDTQEIIPKGKKIFVCPSCNHQSTFENYFSYTAVTVFLCIVIIIIVQGLCIFTDNKCSSFKEYISIAKYIFVGLFALQIYVNKWVPRLKSYKP